MRLMDELLLNCPWYGSRQMVRALRRKGHRVGRKRVRRLMRVMGLRSVVPRPNTSCRAPGHWVYPYLLHALAVVLGDSQNCPPGDTKTDPPRHGATGVRTHGEVPRYAAVRRIADARDDEAGRGGGDAGPPRTRLGTKRIAAEFGCSPTIVGRRMKCTGMRWSVAGANPVLWVRCTT